MKNKNKILLTVLSILTLLVAMVGATFAYFAAIGTSEDLEISTGSTAITLDINNNLVTNIRPTTFDKAKADSATDKNIVKMILNVNGASNVDGSYLIKMKTPIITIGTIPNQGSVSDIKYSVYSSESNQPIINAQSFTEIETNTIIVENVKFSNGSVDDTYYIYVWVDNNDNEQNNLQDISFKLAFMADTVTQ